MQDATDQIRQGLKMHSARTDAAAARATIARGVRDLGVAAARRAAGESTFRSALADIEVKRLDKQPGAGPNAPGTTSLVERGTVPYLLGLAVESGAVTRTQEGTSITFRARPASLIKFLAANDYLNSTIDAQSSTWTQLVNKASLSVTFDTSRDSADNAFTGTSSQVAGYSFRYDIYNRRDPRAYRGRWLALNTNEQAAWTNALASLGQRIQADPAFSLWVETTVNSLLVAGESGVDAEIDKAVDSLANQLTAGRLDEEYRRAIGAYVVAWNRFAAARVAIINNALRSPTLSAEYVVIRQKPVVAGETTGTTGPNTAANTLSAAGTALPDLGTLRFVASAGVFADGNLTLNASMTNFNNTFRGDRIRDYRVGLQLDAPVADLGELGKVSFSLAALYHRVQNQPLGEKVIVNGLEIDSRGNIWFGQAKIEFPFGSSGVRVPVAITYASREELLKNEKNKFGAHIGLTFDVDKLIAAKR
jgi:hypothetical protein